MTATAIILTRSAREGAGGESHNRRDQIGNELCRWKKRSYQAQSVGASEGAWAAITVGPDRLVCELSEADNNRSPSVSLTKTHENRPLTRLCRSRSGTEAPRRKQGMRHRSWSGRQTGR